MGSVVSNVDYNLTVLGGPQHIGHLSGYETQKVSGSFTYDGVATSAASEPKHTISGTVKLSDGTVYLGGATVILVRESSMQPVAWTTSSTTDGTYAFKVPRTDPHRYVVHAFGGSYSGVSKRDLTAT